MFNYRLMDLDNNVIKTTTNDENGNVIFKDLMVTTEDVDDETGKEKVTLSTPAEVKVVNGYKLILMYLPASRVASSFDNSFELDPVM